MEIPQNAQQVAREAALAAEAVYQEAEQVCLKVEQARNSAWRVAQDAFGLQKQATPFLTPNP